MPRTRGRLLLIVPLLASACGDGSTVPPPLLTEAARMVAVSPPDGWQVASTGRLSGDYFVIEVEGVDVIAAGDFRNAESVRATTVAVAWESPVLGDAVDVTAACRDVARFAERAKVEADVEVEACANASVDPNLRDGFVLSFADHVEATGEGTRSFGAGILREKADGVTTLRVVTSLSFSLPPP